LTVPEAAMLAGIVNSPYYLNPYSHFEAALSRQRLVLRRMHAKGFIDAAEYKITRSDSVQLSGQPSFGNDFINYVISVAEERFGREAVQYGGLKIYTTMDPQLQALAEEASSKASPSWKRIWIRLARPCKERWRRSTCRPAKCGRWLRAPLSARRIQSRRQQQSPCRLGIKPFVYFAALENLHLTPISIVNDSAVTFKLPNRQRWSPRNFDRRHHKQLTLKSALMQSINIISARLTDQITPKRLMETCRRFGITSLKSPQDEILSLSLGSGGIAPLEMAAAYAIFANGGVYYKPIVIKRVEDVNGMILDRAFVFGDPRLDPLLSYEMLDMMAGVINGGTARVIRDLGFDAPARAKPAPAPNSPMPGLPALPPSFRLRCGWGMIEFIRCTPGYPVSGAWMAAAAARRFGPSL
jgi:penicillin-binding protein 1A